MKISEHIAQTLLNLLQQEGGIIKIQRNELASQLGCAPSQINYVLTSRFTTENGFLVESRRGGGGFIQIIKIEHSKRQLLFHLIHSIEEKLDEQSARIILQNLTFDKIFTPKECKLMMSVLSEQSLRMLSHESRKQLRATLLKVMLLQASD